MLCFLRKSDQVDYIIIMSKRRKQDSNKGASEINSEEVDSFSEVTDRSDITTRLPVNNSLHEQEQSSVKRVVLRVVAGRDMLHFAVVSSNSPVLIGRDEGSDLCLRDRAVSSRHAKVLYTKNNNNKWTLQIIDLGSTNGTMVNGDTIQASPLLIGDYIEIGDVALRVSLLSEQEIEHLQRILSRLSQANTDPLTGLYTRAFLQEELPQIIESNQERDVPISCAFVDLDSFKPINDNFGHQVGDEVLKNVSKLIMMRVRNGDACIRYGGDEILIILVGVDERKAFDVISRIRHAIAVHDWGRIVAGLAVSASFGVATLQKDEPVDGWFKRADQSVYAAKASGKNRVIAFGQIEKIQNASPNKKQS